MTTSAIQTYFERQLQAAWAARYAAHLSDVESDIPLLPGSRMPWEWRGEILAGVPRAVAEAYRYYFEQVEQADWGKATLWKVDADGVAVYAVYVTTDGDDGWLELFDEAGAPLGSARRYLELLAWDPDVAAVRAFTASGGYPPELADAATRTLWGK